MLDLKAISMENCKRSSSDEGNRALNIKNESPTTTNKVKLVAFSIICGAVGAAIGAAIGGAVTYATGGLGFVAVPIGAATGAAIGGVIGVITYLFNVKVLGKIEENAMIAHQQIIKNEAVKRGNADHFIALFEMEELSDEKKAQIKSELIKQLDHSEENILKTLNDFNSSSLGLRPIFSTNSVNRNKYEALKKEHTDTPTLKKLEAMEKKYFNIRKEVLGN